MPRNSFLLLARKMATIEVTDEEVSEFCKEVDALMKNWSLESSSDYPFDGQSVKDLLGVLCVPKFRLSDLVVSKVLDLLEMCADCVQLKVILQSEMTVFSSLTELLMSTDNCGISLKCLKLLHCISYGGTMVYPRDCTENILRTLVSIILGADAADVQCALSLKTLCNILRYNKAAQMFVKRLPMISGLQRRLVSNLSGENVSVIISSLHILASISFGDELESTVFSAGNVEQALQLIFSVLCSNRHQQSTVPSAVDLLVDITSSQRNFTAIKFYPKLNKCIEHIVASIDEFTDALDAEKIFELCIVFCEDSSLKDTLLTAVLKPLRRPGLKCESIVGVQCSPLGCLLRWACDSDKDYAVASTRSLQLMQILFQAASSASMAAAVTGVVDMNQLMSLMLAALTSAPSTSNEEFVSASLLRICEVLSLMNSMLLIGEFASVIEGCIDSEILDALVMRQLKISASHHEFRKTAARVVLLVLELYRRHRVFVKGELKCKMTDARLLLLLAYTLFDGEPNDIELCLSNVFDAAKNNGIKFSSFAIALSDARVEYLQHAENVVPREMPPSCLVKNISSACNTDADAVLSSKCDQDVELLTKKFETGIKLQKTQLKEAYEQKLQEYESKQIHLQELIDARALALSQADRLIAQYRATIAHSDEMMEKLCAKNTTLSEEMNAATLKQNAEIEAFKMALSEKCRANQQLKKEHEALLEDHSHNKSEYEKLQADHQSITRCYQNAMSELEDMQQVMKTTQASSLALQSRVEQLETELCSLHSEHTRAIEQVAAVEMENSELSSRNYEMDTILKEFKQKNAALQEEVNLFSAVRELINKK